MVTPFVAIRLVAATVLLGTVALAGTAMAKPASGEASLAAAAPAATSAAVAAPAPVAEPVSACARKVKVVYAGYGEAARATCAVSAKASAN